MTRRRRLILLCCLVVGVLLLVFLPQSRGLLRLPGSFSRTGGQGTPELEPAERSGSSGSTGQGSREELSSPDAAPAGIPPAAAESQAARLANKIGSTRIRGHVVDERGRPVREAEVRASEFRELGRPFLDRASTRTDPSGNYELQVSTLGRTHLRVTADKQGFAAAEAGVATDSPTVFEVNLVLRQARAWVKGRVTTDQGEPVSGAAIYLVELRKTPGGRTSPSGYSHMDPLQQRAESATDGTFVFRDLPLVSVSVGARSPEFRQALQLPEIDLQPGENVVEISLTRSGAFSVLVKNRRNEPVPNAYALAYFGRQPRRFRGDPEGRIQVLLPAEIKRADIEVTAPGYRLHTCTLTSEVPSKEVVLEDGMMLRGQVVNQGGTGIQGAGVMIVACLGTGSRGQQVPAGTGQTDSGGRFEIRISNDRHLSVRVGHPRYLNHTEWVESLPDPPELTVVLPDAEAALHGTVVDHEGKPVPEFDLMISDFKPLQGRPTDPLDWWRARVGFETFDHFNDDLGRFQFPALPAGVLYVEIADMTGPAKLQQISVPKGVDSEMTIRLDPPDEQ